MYTKEKSNYMYFSCNDCSSISPFLWSSNTGFEVFVIFERIKEPFGFSALSFFKGLHFLEKYKFESTIGQQMKLIDYLQALYEDNNSNKKKKVDSLSPPTNLPPSCCPSSWSPHPGACGGGLGLSSCWLVANVALVVVSLSSHATLVLINRIFFSL